MKKQNVVSSVRSSTTEIAFNNAKLVLTNASLLNFPKAHSHTALFVDASEISCDTMLQQKDEKGVFQFLKFLSKSFTKTSVKYSTFDRESLADYLAVQHFAYFLEGRTFTLHAGHQPLVGALAKHRSSISYRQSRQLSFIAEFTSDIRHIPGNTNVVGDCQGRPEANVLFSFASIDSSAFA